MGKIKTFKFTFQDNKAVFYPGQWVCGQCSLKLDEPLKIKGLQICLIGKFTRIVVKLLVCCIGVFSDSTKNIVFYVTGTVSQHIPL